MKIYFKNKTQKNLHTTHPILLYPPTTNPTHQPRLTHPYLGAAQRWYAGPRPAKRSPRPATRSPTNTHAAPCIWGLENALISKTRLITQWIDKEPHGAIRLVSGDLVGGRDDVIPLPRLCKVNLEKILLKMEGGY